MFPQLATAAYSCCFISSGLRGYGAMVKSHCKQFPFHYLCDSTGKSAQPLTIAVGLLSAFIKMTVTQGKYNLWQVRKWTSPQEDPVAAGELSELNR